MNASRVAAIATVVLGVSAGIARADHILVSRGVSGLNMGPTVAVNDTTGDVLIAWVQQPTNGSFSRVWASLLKRNPDGTFRSPKRPRRVSPPQGFHNNVSVAWIPAANAYFLVWDTRRVAGAASKIMGRRLNKNGGFFGPVRTLVSDGRENFGPVVAAEDPVARVAYSAKDATVAVVPLDGTEVATVRLNRALQPDSQTVVALLGLIAPSVESFFGLPESCQLLIIQNVDSPTLRSITVVLLQDGQEVTSLEILDATYESSGIFKRGIFGQAGDLAISTGTVRNPIVSYTVCDSLELDARVMRVVEERGLFRAEIVDRPQPSEDKLLAARGPAVFDFIVSDNGRLLTRGYNENAKQTGPRKTLADDVGRALFLDGAALPAATNDSATAPDAILTWLLGVGTGSQIYALPITRD